ncbi:MAG: sulfatase-like hydrolase/transferase, partial [Planctomycetota bacterium]
MSGPDGRRPNILFITTDYTRGVDLPSGGAPFLRMPNVDRLCAEGAVFAYHVSTCPICMPARATWVTGLYPHTHGLWDNLGRPFPRGGPFLIRDLKALGYFTAGIGKMHFHPWQDDYGFDVRVVAEGKDLADIDDDYGRYLGRHGHTRKEVHGFRGPYRIRGGQTVYDWPLDEELHQDYFIGREAVEVIRRGDLHAADPWLMWVSFVGPHNPWNAPGRLAEPYREMEDLPLGDFVEGELMHKPLQHSRHRYCYGRPLFDVYDRLPPDGKEDLRRRVRAAHYGSLTFIDESIGLI